MNHMKVLSNLTNDGYVDCIVEIPKGSSVKYEINKDTGEYVEPVRELNKRYKYPFNYGFIPNTLEEDGDPMDVCIIGCQRLEPLTHVKCKIVGCFKTVDNGEQDDKILVAPVYIRDTKSIAKEVISTFNFLKVYKYPYQKNTIIDGKFYAQDEAIKLIEQAIERCNSKKSSTFIALS